MKINILENGEEKVGVTYDPVYREQRENFHTIMKSIDTTELTILEIYNEVRKVSLIPNNINVLRCYIKYHKLPYKKIYKKREKKEKKEKKITSVQTNSSTNKFIDYMNKIHKSNKYISTGLLIKESKTSRQRVHKIFKSNKSLFLTKDKLNIKLVEDCMNSIHISNKLISKELLVENMKISRLRIDQLFKSYESLLLIKNKLNVKLFEDCMNKIHLSNKLISTESLVRNLKITRPRIEQIFKSYESILLTKNKLNNKLLENRKK